MGEHAEVYDEEAAAALNDAEAPADELDAAAATAHVEAAAVVADAPVVPDACEPAPPPASPLVA
eukprot:6078236-Prymnesium_polylepis.1